MIVGVDVDKDLGVGVVEHEILFGYWCDADSLGDDLNSVVASLVLPERVRRRRAACSSGFGRDR